MIVSVPLECGIHQSYSSAPLGISRPPKSCVDVRYRNTLREGSAAANVARSILRLHLHHSADPFEPLRNVPLLKRQTVSEKSIFGQTFMTFAVAMAMSNT